MEHQKSVAFRFATASGLILGFVKCVEFDVRKFDCEKFSCHSKEREILFFGGDTVLRLKKMTQHVGGGWKSYDKMLLPLSAFRQMIAGQPISSETKRVARKSGSLRRILRDVILSRISVDEEMKTPDYIWKLALYYITSNPQIRLIYDELMKNYMSLHCITKTDGATTLNCANIAVLFSGVELIVFLMAYDYHLSDLEYLSLVKDIRAIFEMKLSITFQFEWPAITPSAVKTKVHLHVQKLQSEGLDLQCTFTTNCVLLIIQSIEQRSDAYCERSMMMIDALCPMSPFRGPKEKLKKSTPTVKSSQAISKSNASVKDRLTSPSKTPMKNISAYSAKPKTNNGLITKIDERLRRWYVHCGRDDENDYDSMFARFCDDSMSFLNM